MSRLFRSSRLIRELDAILRSPPEVGDSGIFFFSDGVSLVVVREIALRSAACTRPFLADFRDDISLSRLFRVDMLSFEREDGVLERAAGRCREEDDFAERC